MRKVVLILMFATPLVACGQTVARKWNEAMLSAIRIDRVRPTVHARNLFHVSTAMYDAWACYDDLASTYLISKPGVPFPGDVEAARDEAISYAAYRLLKHRYATSFQPDTMRPKFEKIFDDVMDELGYDPAVTSKDYTTGSAAALGNYIAEQIINFGLNDLANEQANYANEFYEPVNSPLVPIKPGNPKMVDCNRWQPLSLTLNCDQNGICVSGGTTPFLSPEWGEVTPFAMDFDDVTRYTKDTYEFKVYHDPGSPPLMDSVGGLGQSKDYIWTFGLVSVWSGQLDQSDGVMIDISPASVGNIPRNAYPTTSEGMRDFYKLTDGGDIGTGYDVNPRTGKPYEPEFVPRGDYARVLAEFWADGPNSETPPGHWFTLLNYVNDHPLLEKRFGGEGPVLDDLEWDVKSYFILGGAVHDAAISAWSIKGYYDYVRPISAIRFMDRKGQSTDPGQPSYNPAGMMLIPGYIEVVKLGDPLAGPQNENLGKIKVKSWRGTSAITDPSSDQAGVGWILAENWVPYQRPSFVTPPFAGYISGHSTFSSSAAEVLTLLTGDEYFPGGIAKFPAKKNEYLVFEEGPSVDVVLQWARYRDASDQCSLSRIWGGIHPPADDMPGRLIGMEIGADAFRKASGLFTNTITGIEVGGEPLHVSVFPNPANHGERIFVSLDEDDGSPVSVQLTDAVGREQLSGTYLADPNHRITLDLPGTNSGIYIITVQTATGRFNQKIALR